MIYIFSSKNSAALGRALGTGKINWVEIRPQSLLNSKSEQKFNAEDQIYLDISGLTQTELKKALGLLKKSGAFWGIIDPKGEVTDPASLFFESAGDYIGPALVKKGLDKKRFASAFSWFLEGKASSIGKSVGKETAKSGKPVKGADGDNKKKTHLLPEGEFEGWKSIRTGATANFFFLYMSLSEKLDLRPMMGEIAFKNMRNRLREVLQQNLRESGALLWMETEGNSLFLVPPRAANCRDAIEAALKMILNSRLIGIERLGLSIPLEFIFALHYGQTAFQAPGKTGAIISEPVNYIFHLGTKKAETGRLTISGDVPEEVFPVGLSDLFIPAGVFEGIPIRHSKCFVYK